MCGFMNENRNPCAEYFENSYKRRKYSADTNVAAGLL
jgi:hypothetical protein